MVEIVTHMNGVITEIKKPDFIRFPFELGQVLNRDVETWAEVNGWEIDGAANHRKVFGVPVKILPECMRTKMGFMRHLAGKR